MVKQVLTKLLNQLLLLLFHPLVKSNPRALKAKALSAWMKGNVSQGLNTMSKKTSSIEKIAITFVNALFHFVSTRNNSKVDPQMR